MTELDFLAAKAAAETILEKRLPKLKALLVVSYEVAVTGYTAETDECNSFTVNGPKKARKPVEISSLLLPSSNRRCCWRIELYARKRRKNKLKESEVLALTVMAEILRTVFYRDAILGSAVREQHNKQTATSLRVPDTVMAVRAEFRKNLLETYDAFQRWCIENSPALELDADLTAFASVPERKPTETEIAAMVADDELDTDGPAVAVLATGGAGVS